MMYALEYCALMCKFFACIKNNAHRFVALEICWFVSLRTSSNVVSFGVSCWAFSIPRHSNIHSMIRTTTKNMVYYNDLRVHIMTRVEITWHGVFAFILLLLLFRNYMHSVIIACFVCCCCFFHSSKKSIRISVYYAHCGNMLIKTNKQTNTHK